MKLAIMQPYFFPYIGYFQAISAVDKYILYENLDFITHGWMHRNRILLKYREPFYIIVCTTQKGFKKKTYEICLAPGTVWKKKILNTIAMNYKASQFFGEIFPILDEIIMSDFELLYQYSGNTIRKICDYLSIPTQVQTENQNYRALENELSLLDEQYTRFPHLLKTRPDVKTARIIEICRNENAQEFINAIGGKDLYDANEIMQYGIDIKFIKTLDFQYSQPSKEFIPNLSIIDVLMNCGKERTQELLSHYELVK